MVDYNTNVAVLSLMCDNISMIYEIKKTIHFDNWLAGLKDAKTKARVLLRVRQVSQGNFGDHKSLGAGLFEMRFFFGSGYRIYYTVKNKQVVILLTGGDKSSQEKDIKKAKSILDTVRLGQ
ncbi:type II toxin-antitoxin system RelE/ParE family toxin [methanotrophic endosymbiont of Bathymodiolus puteoserpentis (Logatchev)]|jgi:putative addiction module killer protein|uniref:type II toxin-antitoxin system RelE/ParE family toxin n=1 Tax=methanotrophic endosymbiont of Bathymodiolus puteoserpentis (Logatchev) TaxID=343235 RepID=UPI001FDA1F1C|nr:type II toxin-antitoxin system RelE/ParE family toxin [methanotrophic endosymbiont of Bathymodiolus puteoserpentis (Logatchev)]